MSVNYDELLRGEAFKPLSDEQKKAYAELSRSLSGKSPSESLPIMISFMKNMPKGRTLSSEEQNAMIDVILASLPPEDAKKFQNVIKFVVSKQKSM
jgi:hypothetical protein